jgi:hypothetical protein
MVNAREVSEHMPTFSFRISVMSEYTNKTIKFLLAIHEMIPIIPMGEGNI